MLPGQNAAANLDERTRGKLERGLIATRFYELEGNFRCAPAPAGPKDLVFGSEEGTLVAVVRTTGEVVWKRPKNGPIFRTPQVKGRAVFVSPRSGELIGYDTRTGQEIVHTQPGEARGGTVAASDRIFFVNGRVLAAYAPRAEGMGLAWTFEAKARILAGPVVHGDSVFIADEQGNFYRLEAND
jgi:outer membrane protein assembly factor BamB